MKFRGVIYVMGDLYFKYFLWEKKCKEDYV